ncbi:MAG: BON domain-containing protein [Dehalococcoidia bacterium]
MHDTLTRLPFITSHSNGVVERLRGYLPTSLPQPPSGLIQKVRAVAPSAITLSRRPKTSPWAKWRFFGLGFLAGSVFFYFFDPDRGAYRRAELQNRLRPASRSLSRRLRAGGHGVTRAGSALGTVGGRVRAVAQRQDPSDAALAVLVGREIYAVPDLAISELHVEATKGVVLLRGSVENDEAVDRARELVGGLEGVREVRTELNVRGENAIPSELSRG